MAHAGAHQGLRNVARSSAPAGPHQGAAQTRGTATGTHSRAHGVHGMLSMMPRQRDTQKFTLALWDVSVGHHSRHTMLKVPGLSSPAGAGGLGARALVVFKGYYPVVWRAWRAREELSFPEAASALQLQAGNHLHLAHPTSRKGFPHSKRQGVRWQRNLQHARVQCIKVQPGKSL